MSASDALRWSTSDWRTKITFAKPSGDGAVGVVFVWTTPNVTTLGKASWDNPATSSFVIKPLAGSAAPTKMAEDLLGKLAGAASPGSRAVPASSARGQAILAALSSARNISTSPARWNQVWPSYLAADTFLIQDMQSDGKQMGHYYREHLNLAILLQMNAEFMRNLGMLLVADAVIGNGDRLWKPNMGNIMFKPGGRMIAIDSATILTNFNALLTAPDLDDGVPRWGQVGGDDAKTKTPENWARNQVSPKGITDVEIGGIASSFSMQTLWDIDNWWQNTFKWHLEKGLPDRKQMPPATFWDKGKAAFMAGVQEGMNRVDRLFATKSWDWLLLKFKWYANKKKYGDDPNMDWMNLKVRRLYYQMRRAGKSHKEAEDLVLDYVKRKRDKIMNG